MFEEEEAADEGEDTGGDGGDHERPEAGVNLGRVRKEVVNEMSVAKAGEEDSDAGEDV